jgi:hypothetical protein
MRTITQPKSELRKVQHVNQTIVNSVYADALKQLKSRDGKISKKLIEAFVQVKLNGLGYYNIMIAGTGIGKTHHVIQEFNHIMYKEGIRLSFIVAPETMLISEEALGKHIKVLRRKLGGNIDVSYSPSISEIRNKLKRRDNDELLLFVLSDKKFNMIINELVVEINKHNLVGKTFFSFDECHISGTSEAANYYQNTGLKNSNAECVKFGNIEKILDICYVLGVSATLIKEQFDVDFGSDRYRLLNNGFTKEEIGFVVSGHKPTIFYNEDIQSRDKTLMTFLGYAISEQLRYESMHNSCIGGKTYIDENGVTKFADDLLQKLTGAIILETQYKDNDKDDIKWFKGFMNQPSMTIPSNWDFDVALDTSDEMGVWRFRDGKITELSRDEELQNGYDTSDSLIASMSDTESKLKFLVLVGKGSVGMDILPLNFLLSMRTFTNKFEGTPVTHRAEQLLGRCRRLVLTIEELAPFFDDVEQFIKYYTMVNSYQAFLPNKEYWISAQSEIDKKYPSEDDIAMMIRQAVGKC